MRTLPTTDPRFDELDLAIEGDPSMPSRATSILTQGEDYCRNIYRRLISLLVVFVQSFLHEVDTHTKHAVLQCVLDRLGIIRRSW